MPVLYLLEMLLLYLLAAVCEDDLSQELTFITDVGGFAEILNEGDDLIQGSQRPQRGRRPDPGFAETHRGRRPRRSERF